jgi:hypothetical protein
MRSFAIFFLCFSLLNSYSQEIMTIREVFDYDIGDELQIRSNLPGQPPNAIRLTIIDKDYSISKDTVFYRIARNNYSTTREEFTDTTLIYSFIYDTIQVTYTNLDSSIFTYKKMLGINFDNNGNCDSIVQFSAENCGILINGFQIGGWDYYKFIFGKGVGLIDEYVVYEESGNDYPWVYNSLFYFKKSTIECGIPDRTTGINEKFADDFVKIYPIPANQYLNIEISPHFLGHCRVTILNLYGKQIMTQSGTSFFSFNVTDVQKGLYFLQLNSENGTITKKVLIQ